MIKLHLFTGFENKDLGITPDMEVGHLYSDDDNKGELVDAAVGCGLNSGYIQSASLVHFDLWGKPLERAKKRFRIVSDLELSVDMKLAADRRIKGKSN